MLTFSDKGTRCAARVRAMTVMSPVGTLTLAATERGLCGIYFDEHRHFVRPVNWVDDRFQPHLLETARQLDDYFSGCRRHFTVPLDLQGTAFQHQVWQQLTTIAFAQTRNYGQHAAAIGRPTAARAVGTAIGRNPVSIIVPCHRVVASDGQLTGYAGGIDRKRMLLQLEQRCGEGADVD